MIAPNSHSIRSRFGSSLTIYTGNSTSRRRGYIVAEKTLRLRPPIVDLNRGYDYIRYVEQELPYSEAHYHPSMIYA